MVDDVSEFWLDRPDSDCCTLALDLHPYVRLPSHPAQRVTIEVEEAEVYRAELSQPTVCNIQLPASALPPGSRIHVTIRHPDAVSPKDLTGTDDLRRLALSIREARVCQTEPPSVEQGTEAPEKLAAPVVVAEPARLSTVFVGNCQMGALASLYRRLLPADGDHDVKYVASYKDATADARKAVADATTVVQQVLTFVPRIGDLATSAMVVLVPHASATFLWPYAGSPHPLNRPETALGQTGPYKSQTGDSFLNRMIATGTAPATAVAAYLAADLPTVRRAERMMELHLQKQRERDAVCGIHVADRIEAQFRSTRLFRSPDHPEPAMTAWIASEVFARMDADAADIARLVTAPPDVFPATETPIHPAVARHFGLDYAPPNRRYRFFDEGGFTFTEYADRYMRYDWNAALAEGMHLLRQKQTHLAVSTLEAAVAASPRSAIARMALAEAFARLGRLKDAVEYACQAVEIEPENESFVKRRRQFVDSLQRQAPAPIAVSSNSD